MSREIPHVGAAAATAALSGAQLTMRLLRQHGLETIFALSGNGVLGLFDAALDEGIRIIDTRHEIAAVQGAAGLALVTRSPQVCIVTEGPGFCNALGGIAALHHDGVPVVVLSNCEGDELFGTGCMQEVPQVEAAAPISKWSTKVHDIRHLPEVLARAFREAREGVPGPVVITLPNHVLCGRIAEGALAQREHGRAGAIPPAYPSPSFVAACIERLRQARKPLLIVGDAAYWDRADDVLARFVEHTRIPVGTCGFARGLIPDDHPCCFGEARPGAAPPATAEADVVLVLGERIDWVLGFGRYWQPDTTFIQVHPDPAELRRSVDAALVSTASAAAVLEALLDAAGPDAWPDSGWQTQLGGYCAWQGAAADASGGDDAGIHPEAVGRALREVCGRDAVTVFDGANSMLWVRGQLPAGYADRCFELGRLGMIGTGLPLSLGAKVLHPEAPVVLFVGDGSLGFHFMEFETALRHALPVVIVVGNDSAWGIEQHFQRGIFGRETGTALSLVRYDLMARALGGFGVFVETLDELAPAIESALAAGTPAIVNVKIRNVAHPAILRFTEGLKAQHARPT